MPVDTAAKRRSAAAVGFPPWVPGVTPDAAKPVAWRQQGGWGYSGIASGDPVVPAPSVDGSYPRWVAIDSGRKWVAIDRGREWVAVDPGRMWVGRDGS